MKRIHCGLENPRQSKCCIKCGITLAVPLKCPQCGSNNPGDSLFCIVCGARLSFLKENLYSVEVSKKVVRTSIFTTKEKGTGLGLPIAKKIVEAHEGRHEVLKNPEGAGVTFRAIIPF